MEIKKAQALDYIAGQQEQQQWDLERPLDRYIEPLDQVADKDIRLPETNP